MYIQILATPLLPSRVVAEKGMEQNFWLSENCQKMFLVGTVPSENAEFGTKIPILRIFRNKIESLSIYNLLSKNCIFLPRLLFTHESSYAALAAS